MEEMMKAVAITGLNTAEIIRVKRPTPGPNQILIRVRACAICTWEQRVFNGVKKLPLPHVGGHEIVGEIAAIGEGVNENRFPIGAIAAGRTLISCGTCYFCRRGYHTQCENAGRLRNDGPEIYGNGGLAEYICLEDTAVWRLDSCKDFPELSLTEPLACVLNSMHRASPRMGDDAVIIGGGVLGQLKQLVFKKMGLRTILSEPDPVRREFALAHGCDIVIDPLAEDPVSKVKELTGGRGAEVVINTTAVPAVMEQAVAMTAPLGRCVAYSSQHPDRPIPVSPNKLHSAEYFLTGAVNPSIDSFDQAVNLLSKNIVDLSDMVSAVYPMERAQEAFEAAQRADTYRVVITMD